jgi:hypothetical protein
MNADVAADVSRRPEGERRHVARLSENVSTRPSSPPRRGGRPRRRRRRPAPRWPRVRRDLGTTGTGRCAQRPNSARSTCSGAGGQLVSVGRARGSGRHRTAGSARPRRAVLARAVAGAGERLGLLRHSRTPGGSGAAIARRGRRRRRSRPCVTEPPPNARVVGAARRRRPFVHPVPDDAVVGRRGGYGYVAHWWAPAQTSRRRLSTTAGAAPALPRAEALPGGAFDIRLMARSGRGHRVALGC